MRRIGQRRSGPSARRLRALAVAIAFAFGAAGAGAFPSQPGTGVTINDTTKANPGHIVFTGPDSTVYIMRQDGTIDRTITSPIPNTQIGFARPILNGNLLARLRTPPGNPEVLLEMTFAGVPVWSYVPFGYHPHHDHLRISNGNTMVLCDREFTVPEISPRPLQDDCIIEVDRAGNVVWSWQTAPHFHEFGFSDETKARISAAGGDWAHANAIDVIPDNAPTDDPRFRPGNILISYRHIDTIAVIDRQTSAIVETFQNMTVGQHNIHMIPMGLPGGGNFLVFDNGYSDPVHNPGAAAPNGAPTRDHSRVIEFDPRDPDNPVWIYTARMSGRPNWWFFSSFISAAQRLPNGNTFITEGMNGRLFEVTPAGEIVWEFVSPYAVQRLGGLSNQIFRGYKIPQ